MNKESQVIQRLFQSKEDFVLKVKERLISDTLRQFVINAIPEECLDVDRDYDSPSFREKFKEIVSPLSKKIIDDFQHVGTLKTGKVFTNIVKAIDETAEREGEFRANRFINDIKLHNIDLNTINGDAAVDKTFESFQLSGPIAKTFRDDVNFILSTEDVAEIIKDIKENVKDSIAETEAKQELVKATNQEILDYKREIAPPDMKAELINHDSDDINPDLNDQDAIDPNMIEPKDLEGKGYYTGEESFTAPYSVEAFAEKYLPTHATVFADMEMPDKYTLASEMFTVAGDLTKDIDRRFTALEYSLKNSAIIGEESVPILKERINDYRKLTKEACDICNMWSRDAQVLGITQNSLLNSQENTLSIAKNIITRFITNERMPANEMLPYTSNENLIINAFDLMQLRHMVDEGPYSESVANEYLARENLFFKHLLDWDDKKIKEQAQAIIDMGKMKVEKAFTPEFIRDFKMKAWEMNVKPNINPDAHAEVVNRVKETFEQFYGRPLNKEEIDIIEATAEQRDVTEICPTPFEKFVIQLTNNQLDNNTKSQEAFMNGEIEESTRKGILSNAILLTTMFMTVEQFGLLPSNDWDTFESFKKMLKK